MNTNTLTWLFHFVRDSEF